MKKVHFAGSMILIALHVAAASQVADLPLDLRPHQKSPYLDGQNIDARMELFIKDHPEWTEKDKITYLLESISKSGMKFIRNGSEYTSNQAKRWLAWKMRHRQFRKKPILTAKGFIKRVSTRSNTSGQYYELISADGKRHRVHRVLENELHALELKLEETLLKKVFEEQTVVAEEIVVDKLQTAILVPTPTPSS